MDYDVRSIAEALMMCGINAGKVDGIMGPVLKGAIKKFQKEWDLTADGIFGEATAAAMVEALAEAETHAAELAGYFSGDGSSVEDEL